MIFLDTGFLYGLVNKRGENHQRVREVMDEYRGCDLRRLVLTTNHVVEETITLVRSSVHRDPGIAHDIAVEVGRRLYAEALAGSIMRRQVKNAPLSSTSRGIATRRTASRTA